MAKPALERAFRATHALEMKDLFLNGDLAIGTGEYPLADETARELAKRRAKE